VIRIDRGRGQVPAALAHDGQAELLRLHAKRRARTLLSADFNRTIYSSVAVRSALWEMQHRKCCFCEHRYERKHSTVEHFRPKTRARAASGRKQWGYWWLAYSFNNLYFCCQNCNAPKSDWFPIAGGRRRYRPGEEPWSAAYQEPKLILDPGYDDPERHITFVRGLGGSYRIAGLDARGRWTVRAAQLDRDDLAELRDAYHQEILQPVIDLFVAGQVAQARSFATLLVRDRMEYALLARVVFRDAGILP